MAIYKYSKLTNNQQIVFNTALDVLQFDDNNIDSASILILQIGFDLQVSYGSNTFTLTNVLLEQLTSSNVIFSNGSLFLVGDNTTETINDAQANHLTGGTGNDLILGLGGNDTLSGNLGNDRVEAGDGNDIIDTGDGNDTINAGSGSDTVDAGAGDDTVSVIANNYENDTVHGGDGSDHLSADFSANNIFGGLYWRGYDATGTVSDLVGYSSGLTQIQAALAGAAKYSVTAGPYYYGVTFDGIENLSLTGTQYGDLLVLLGGMNANYDGKGGIDSLYADLSGSAEGLVIDNTVDTFSLNGATVVNVENLLVHTGSGSDVLTLGDYDDKAATGAGDDTINAGGGNNTIDTGAGDDTVNAGGGNDIIDTGDGNDLINAGSGSDTVDAGAGDDTVSVIANNYENDTVHGGDGSDRLTADFSANNIFGGLYWRGYDATGTVSDLVGYSSGLTQIQAALAGAAKYAVTAGPYYYGVTFDGIENLSLTGTQYSDLLVLLGGLNTGYNGKGGIDSLYADLSGSAAGLVIDNTVDTFSLNGATVVNVENLLVHTGSGSDVLTLGDYDDKAATGEGDDTINAGGGNNTIDTGAGSDTVNAGGGNDIIDTGDGNDTINAGSGSDTVDAGAGDDTVSVIANNYENDTVHGGDGSDRLTADFSANNIFGGLYWRGYDATGTVSDLVGYSSGLTQIQAALAGAAKYSVTAGPYYYGVTFDGIENLSLTGTQYGDLLVLLGGMNANYDGKGGIDSLYADLSGSAEGLVIDNTVDTFSLNGATVVNVENLLVHTGSGSDVLTLGDYDDKAATGAGDDTINAGGGNNTIDTGAGDDTVNAGGGNDIIDTGDGNDTINAGSGSDTVDAGAGDDTVSVIANNYENDTVHGGDGSDRLTADFSANNIFGGLYWRGYDATGTVSDLVGYSSGLTQIQAALAGAAKYSVTAGPYYYGVTFDGIENLSLIGTQYSDLLVLLGDLNASYDGKGGIDTFYADWSMVTSAIIWDNDPTRNQTVKDITVSGIERLLLLTGSGNDVISNTREVTDDTFVTGAGDDTVDAGRGINRVDTGEGDDFIASLGGSVDGGDGFDTLSVDASSASVASTLSYSVIADSGSATNLYSYSSFDSIRNTLDQFGTKVILNAGDLGAVSFSNIEYLDVRGINQINTGSGDLLIFLAGGSYRGGGQAVYAYDTFYADWSWATSPIVWDNDPTQDQTVNDITVSGLERLLLVTGSGDDVIANSRVTTDDTFITGGGDDRIDAGQGNNRVEAGEGNDTISSLGGSVDGGTGFDTLTVDASSVNANSGLTYTVTPASGSSTTLHYSTSFEYIHDTLGQAGANLSLNAGDLGIVSFSNIERMNLTGVTQPGAYSGDLLILQGSGGSYRGGGQDAYAYDTFYADWSSASSAIIWDNDPSQSQIVNGVSVNELERLLLLTGSGDDVIANSRVTTNDTFITGGGDDRIDAGQGNNRVEAGEGNDSISSLGGSVDGGSGFDTLTVDASSASATSILSYTVTPASGSSTTLHYSTSFEYIHDTLGQTGANLSLNAGNLGIVSFSNIERMNLTGITQLGTYSGDLLILQGSGGSYSGGGQDANACDTFYADWSSASSAIIWDNDPSQNQIVNGVSVNELERLLLLTGSGDDVIANSRVTNDDTFITGAGNDTVNAGAGNDRIETGVGDDTLNGGSGNDTMAGGAGNDSYIVDSSDSVIENSNEGSDTVNSSITYILGADLENLTLTDFSAIDGTGNELDNILIGNSANNQLNGMGGTDWLDGSVGADTMLGGSGDDTYVVDNEGDVITENANEGMDTVRSYVTYTLAANLENMTLVGTASVNVIGNSADNVLIGNSGDNVLSGGTGNDSYLFGLGSGLDTVHDLDLTIGNLDAVKIGAGVGAEDVTVSQAAGQLVLSLNASDQLRIDWDTANGLGIERVEFTDGTVWDAQTLLDQAANHAPFVTVPIGNQTGTQDSAFSFTFPASTFVDLDAGDTLIYSASQANNLPLPSWLEFDPNNLSFNGIPGNSDVGELSIKLIATDKGGASVSTNFSLTIANINDPPILATPISDQSVDEGSAFDFLIPTATFQDIDLADSLSYTASLADDSPLPNWLVFNAGTHRFSGTPAESNIGSLAIKISATDPAGTSAFDEFNLTVSNVEFVPTDIQLSADSILENSLGGTVVGLLSAKDKDTGDTHTFRLTNDAGGRFVIAGNELRVANGALLNYEQNPSLSVTVEAKDSTGLVYSRPLTVNLANVNEAPTAIQLDGTSIEENSPAGTLVGHLSTTDQDAADTLSYQLLDDAGGRFRLAGNVLEVANGSLLDFEQNPKSVIRVRTTDAGGLSFDQNLTVNLSDIQADLTVTQVTLTNPQSQVESGSSVDVSWTLLNSTEGSYAGFWLDRVYLDNPDTAELDRLVAEFPFSGSLIEGQPQTRTQTLRIPINLTGDYRVVVVTDTNNQVTEGNSGENNNTLLGTETVHIVPQPSPNLQVESVTSPATAFTGRPIEVRWVVKNTGNSPTTNPVWEDWILLSTDETFSGNYIVLGAVQNISYLDVGQSYANSATVTLPADREGYYHIQVYADASGSIAELNHEDDNTGSGGVLDIKPIPLSELSDLAVVSVVAPNQVFSGQRMSITYTIDNAGEAPIDSPNANWLEQIYMSTDAVLDNTDRLLQTVWRSLPSTTTQPAIGSWVGRDLPVELVPEPNGQTHFTTTENVTLPVGVYGDYYFFVALNRLSNVTNAFTFNDRAFDAVTTQVRLTPPPDLQVTTLSAPGQAYAGHNLSVNYQVINSGASATPNQYWYDKLYLSSDQFFDNTDLELTQILHSGALNLDSLSHPLEYFLELAQSDVDDKNTAFYNGNLNFSLPHGIAGNYYLIAVTDTLNDVFELDNTNNVYVSATPISIESLPADLIVSSASAPQAMQAGKSALITWTVKNQGAGETINSQWKDLVILSQDDILGNADDSVLGKFQHSGILNAGESYAGQGLADLPFTLSGSVRLFVVTDQENAIPEIGHEDNNSGMATGTVSPGAGQTNSPIQIVYRPLADLRVTGMKIPDTAMSGTEVAFNFHVINSGSGRTSAGYWRDEVVLSRDNVLGNEDDLSLGTVFHNGRLDPAQGYDATATFQLPLDAVGEYQAFIRTDANNYVSEGVAENNNFTSTAITVIQSPVPDLVMGNMHIASEAISGQQVEVDWTVQNTGVDTLGGWRQAFYLSRDQILDKSSDVYLGYYQHNAPIAGQTSQDFSDQFTIPNGVAGQYYLLGVVDNSNLVYEAAGETNNLGIDSTPIKISLPIPGELAPSSLSLQENGKPGTSTQIQYSVINQGNSPISGYWQDNLYLSADNQWDVGDALLARVKVGGSLEVGGSYTQNVTATLPGMEVGDYYLILRSDILNQVNETNEANNSLSSLGTIHLDVDKLDINNSSVGSFGLGQAVYYRMEVGAGETLRIAFDRDASNGRTELFASFGEMPSRANADFIYNQADSPDQNLIIPSSRAGTYYVMAYNALGADDDYAISAETLHFAIDSLSLSKGSNKGQVTVRINGAEFTNHTSANLIDSDGLEHTASQILWKDSTELWATFDLRGLSTGAYDVKLQDGDKSALLDDGFTVNEGQLGHVEYGVETPSALRVGQYGTVRVYYKNFGDTDATAPLLSVSGNVQLKLPQDADFGGNSMQLLGINREGTAGILAPGDEGSFQLIFRPEFFGVPGIVDLNVSNLSPDLVIDWNSILDNSKPDNIDPTSWESIKAGLIAELGSTTTDYQNALAENATHLDQLESRTNDVTRLASLDYLKASNGGTLLQQGELGVLGYGHPFAWDIRAIKQSDGSVMVDMGGTQQLFSLQPNGSYQLAGQGKASLVEINGAFEYTQLNGTRITFNLDGRFNHIEDSNGQRLQASYENGHLAQVAASNGDSLSFSYNDAGRLIQQTDQAGRTTTFGYDAANEHLTQVTTPSGIYQYGYVTTPGAAQHLINSFILPDGTEFHYQYDSQGRLTQAYAGSGSEAITYSYLGVNEIIATDALGHSTHLWLNERGQIAQIEDALGRVSQLRYDENGNMTSLVNADGTSSSLTYDAAGNPRSVLDGLGNRVNLSYESQFGQLAKVTDQRGNPISYGYDSHGNLNKISYADGSSETYTYDTDGYLNVAVNRRGESINYGFDDKGQLTQKTYADGSTASFTYDRHGNLNSATDSDSLTLYEYDAADRLVKVTDSDGRWLSYSYDAAGHRTQMADHAGHVTQYSYNSLGYLAELTDGSGNLIASYQYDETGRLVREDKGNGTYTTHAYDAAGQLIHLVNYQADGIVNSRFDYTYGAAGHRSSETTLEGTTSYGYDSIGQLTSVTLPNGRHIEYRYDAAGNRISVEDDGTTTDYATNNLNQYTSAGTTTYGYDDDGNLTAKTENGITTQYGYDAENHLISVSTPTETWQYEYDALGNRIASVHNGERIEYQLDPSGLVNVASEYDGSGGLIAYYNYGMGLESQISNAGNSYYYDYNAIGSTAGLTGSLGSYVNQYAYLPFGENLVATETVANPFEYVGQWGVAREGNEMDFMRARFYDSGIGRFSSIDPAYQAWANTYSYANNNSILYQDPLGLKTNSIGVNSGVNFLQVGGAFGINLVWDEKTIDPRVQVNFAYGVGMGLGISSNINFTTTDAENSSILRGPGREAGASASPILALKYFNIGGGRVWGDGYNGQTYNLGAGLGAPFELHDFRTNTLDIGSFTEVLDQYSLVLPMIPIIGPSLSPLITANTLAHVIIPVIRPSDPNDIVGPEGFGDEHWVDAKQALPYTIHFENQATATAPAQQVTITQTLDSDLNPASFRLGDFGWGDITVQVPEGTAFYTNRLDYTATKGFLVDVIAGVDVLKHEVFWTFTTIDPATGEIPTNPTIGFLPPDTDGSIGQGFANYTIRANADATTGTIIDAKATIVFDTEEPIDTPSIFNTLDTQLPTSQVQVSGAVSPVVTMRSMSLFAAMEFSDPATVTVHSAQFLVLWSGDDAGSALNSFNVYVSDNEGPYSLWLENTTLTEATYSGLPGHRYAFYSTVSDNANNIETAPAQPDVIVQVASDAVLVDLEPPTVTRIDLLPDGLYGTDQALEFIINFSEAVFVDAATAPPTIALTIGDQPTVAFYVAGSGSDALVFQHLIVSGEYDPNGIAIGNTIELNGGNIRDQAGNPLVSLSLSLGDPSGIRIDNEPVLSAPLADQIITETHAVNFALPAGTFTDADAGDTLSYTATLADGSALPTWLYFDPASQNFSGTPDLGDAGNLDIMITATDSLNAGATDVFTLNIEPLNARLEIHPLQATAAEGDTGITALNFEVVRSENTASQVTVNYAVTGTGNHATSASDFDGGTFPGGTLTFLPGESHQTIRVNVAGDTLAEFNEGLAVTLSSPVNAYLGVSSADGTIQNDDHNSFKIGDAAIRLLKSDAGAWERSWTNGHVSISHKADMNDANEAYSDILFTNAGSGVLNGGDISGGDLGVSGQSLATSVVKQEIDGTEGLRFLLDQEATGVEFNLSRFFANDDGTGLNEAGRVMFYNPAHELVKTVDFVANSLSGDRHLSIDVAEGFNELVFTAGASNGEDFVFGGYGNAAGDGYGGAAAGGHGSDYLVDAVSFEFGEVAVVGSTLPTDPLDPFMV